MTMPSDLPVAEPDHPFRIGIDYRILSSGINLNRGMGRYTQQQLREVLRCDGRNEYVLFCPPFADRSLILPEIIAAPNVTLATIQLPSAKVISDPNEPEQVLRLAEEYQAWIYRQQVDLYHATAPFIWHDTVLPRFDACPMVVNFYDAIPLIFPGQYFPQQDRTADLYTRAAGFILDARRFVAISESARQDAIQLMGYPADQIDIAYPVAEADFQVLPPEVVATRLHSLRMRAHLPGKFVLAVTHLHYSKGIENLLDAYARVPRQLRTQLPLVITCHLTPFEVEYLKTLAHSRGLGDSVIATGAVSDEELAALYNAALLFVHPSRYEGFGMPVLEAMQCGAPVIATAASSLPEVGGNAAVLVPPDDPQALADAIEALYQDPARRAAMRERGFAQARRFDGEQLGRGTLNSYLCAAQTAPAPARPSLALWTPLPPQHSGVADYSANILLSPLAQRYEVEVFVDDGVWPNTDTGRAYKVLHHSAFARRQAQRPFDVIVYQLGASLFHIYMYRYLQQYPGVVVLHDLTWSYALWAWHAQPNRLKAFQEELLETEGSEAVRRLRDVLRTRADIRQPALIAFLDEHWMLSKVVDRSRGVIVHLPALRDELRQRYGTEKVFVVPHAAEDVRRAQDGLRSQEARAGLGIAEEAFWVGVFGMLDAVKRVEVVLEAFNQLAASQPQARLVIAGEAFDPAYAEALRRLAANLNLAERVTFTGYVPDEALRRWVLACDVVVNLRYPSRKQMSGTLVRAIAAGKPLIISDLPEWRSLPDEFCWRVTPGEGEVAALADDLLQLATNDLLRETLSAAARAYYERELTPARMVERYTAVFEQVIGAQPPGAAARPAPAPVTLATPATTRLATALLNKPMEVEDLEAADLSALITALAAPEGGAPPKDWHGAEYRRYWAAAMAVRALRAAERLCRDARVLVIGAGRGPLQYYLTQYTGQVFAVDDYLTLNPRAQSMLVQPELAAPHGAELERLVVQHMDLRGLRFPDESFDAVVVGPSLRQMGAQAEMAGVMFEVGRVLKPGGVASLTVDYQLAGPPGGNGWDAQRPLLTRDGLQRAVVAASGLELADELRLEPSARTLTMPRRLDLQARDISDDVAGGPQFVSVVRGYATIPVHLALRKSAAYPASDNRWARPTTGPHGSSRHPAVAGRARPGAGNSANIGGMAMPTLGLAAPRAGTVTVNATSLEVVRARLNAWSQIRMQGWHNNILRHLPAPLAYLARAAVRLLYLGHSQQAEEYLYLALMDHLTVTQSQLAGVAGGPEELAQQLRDMASALHTSQQALNQDVGRELARLAEYETALAAARADIELLKSELRSMSAAGAGEQRPPVGVTQPAGATAVLSPGELVELLRRLEALVPALAEQQSIKLSLPVGSEETFLAGTAYLGDRLAGRRSVHRSPNDLWYHADLTDSWSRTALFDSALAQLAPGGYFVLLTSADQTGLASPAGLELSMETVLLLATGKSVRVTVWRREARPPA